MAAGVVGVLTTLLITSIFMQFKSVLFNQNSDGHVDFAHGFQWPVKWLITSVKQHENLEVLQCDIKQLNSPKIKLGVVYRPPDTTVQWFEEFETYMENNSFKFDFIYDLI